MFANFLSQVLKLTDTFNEVIILCLRNCAPVGEKAKIILGNFTFESLMEGKISVTDVDREKKDLAVRCGSCSPHGFGWTKAPGKPTL